MHAVNWCHTIRDDASRSGIFYGLGTLAIFVYGSYSGYATGIVSESWSGGFTGLKPRFFSNGEF